MPATKTRPRATKGQQEAPSKRTLDQDDTVKFLIETGRLFEINRTHMHPFGMQLNAVPHDDGSYSLELLQGQMDIHFEPVAFARGVSKRAAWIEKYGEMLHTARKRILGFVVQTQANVSRQAKDGRR